LTDQVKKQQLPRTTTPNPVASVAPNARVVDWHQSENPTPTRLLATQTSASALVMNGIPRSVRGAAIVDSIQTTSSGIVATRAA
jgi:hypothetical protein